MKSIKFRKKLSKLILENKKNVTWRLFDDKDLSEKDVISLVIWETEKQFAKAEIISIKEKKFSELKREDLEGHEKFSTEEEMYKTYSKYYNSKVNGDTLVKVIKFKLLDNLNPKEKKILNVIWEIEGGDAMSFDKILKESKINSEILKIMLIKLEKEGYIEERHFEDGSIDYSMENKALDFIRKNDR